VRTRLVLATGNAHKVTEIADILGPGWEVVAHDPGVDETGTTFEANALLKARAAAAATGLIAVADDSGLAVDVLGGAPGIFSARWSGRHGDDAANLRLLLAQLSDVPDAHRGAQFVCAAALVTPDGREHVETGTLRGALLREPVGDGGFGYDPVLRPDGSDRTCAELTRAEKNAISHRGRAMRALLPHLLTALDPAAVPD
jgi:XTP/dITP diphosphohydrolase